MTVNNIRGFERPEFENRVHRAQTLMKEANIDALVLTTEPEVRYFTGFLTRFWDSPARPWFVIVPAEGSPTAVIPSIGAELMGKGWLEDIRTWRAPDLQDDGVTLLADAIREKLGGKGKVAFPSGHETSLRMPLDSYFRVEKLISPITITADQKIIQKLRLIKSEAEIEKTRTACAIAGRAFARVPEIAREGIGHDEIFRKFQMLCLEEGADWVSYTSGGAGPDGYGDVISPAMPTPLQNGDILMIDTGVVWDGYYSDFDRNFSVGKPSPLAASAHAKLMEAVDAGLEAAKPGNTASDLFHVMNKIVTGGEGVSDAGRLGHGLGMQLTEWPSHIPDDHTVLEEGMVLTLEPGIETRDGRMMVHEEDIVVRSTGAEFLSPRASTHLVEI